MFKTVKETFHSENGIFTNLLINTFFYLALSRPDLPVGF